MDLTRRGFLTGMIATAVVTQLPLPSFASEASIPILWGDGIHDDTAALQALLDGKPIIRDGHLMEPVPGEPIILRGGTYRVSDVLHVRHARTVITECMFDAGDSASATFIRFHDGASGGELKYNIFRGPKVPSLVTLARTSGPLGFA